MIVQKIVPMEMEIVSIGVEIVPIGVEIVPMERGLRLAQFFGFLSKRYFMIRKLKSGEFRIYSRHKDPKTNKRKNLGTFSSMEAAKKHERAIQYFKHA